MGTGTMETASAVEYEEQRRQEEEAAYNEAAASPSASTGLSPRPGIPGLDWRSKCPGNEVTEQIAQGGPPLGCRHEDDGGWHVVARSDDHHLGRARVIAGPYGDDLEKAKRVAAEIAFKVKKPKFKKVCPHIHGQVNGPLALRCDKESGGYNRNRDWYVVRLQGDEPLTAKDDVYEIHSRIEHGVRLSGPHSSIYEAKRDARIRVKAAEGGLGS